MDATSNNGQSAPEPQKILLVEDDNYLADVYVTRFKAEGFEVMRIPDGETAVDTAVQYKPALVLGKHRRDFDALPTQHAVPGTQFGAVHHDLSGIDPVLDSRTRIVGKQLGEDLVQALAGVFWRNGQGMADLGHGTYRRRGARSGWMGRHSRTQSLIGYTGRI